MKGIIVKRLFFFLAAPGLVGCSQKSRPAEPAESSAYLTFGEEVDFLKKYTDVLILREPTGKGLVAVCGALQARVMTSSSNGPGGRSYGWINRALFESGDTLDHINPFGGEERFWLGPEGGQYSIFFPPGAPFIFEEWQTPHLLDLESFQLVESTERKAVYRQNASLTNYSGFTFELGIDRTIEVLTPAEIFRSLGLPEDTDVRAVGYRTTNSLTNRGEADWQKETGLLSIWLLGMLNPSDATTVVIPFIEGPQADLGLVVNDTYFGKVPPERLKIGEDVLYFRGDGKYRSKIGLSPARAKGVLGSYDAENQILTIVKYNQPEGVTDYVNSLWELQDQPYRGDVINSYNDGPPEPGEKPLGPFYELETSSPALALKAGGSGTHIQQTCHFEGEAAALDMIAKRLLGGSLEEMKSAFQ